jgi:hypothetical protein
VRTLRVSNALYVAAGSDPFLLLERAFKEVISKEKKE